MHYGLLMISASTVPTVNDVTTNEFAHIFYNNHSIIFIYYLIVIYTIYNEAINGAKATKSLVTVNIMLERLNGDIIIPNYDV